MHRWLMSLLALVTLSLGVDRPVLAQFNLFGRSVDTIDTKELNEMLSKAQRAREAAVAKGDAQAPSTDFVLVDVRSENETGVSVIPGAITLKQFEANKEQYRQRLVIPYCTVGGRSGSYAKQLEKDGFEVKNYKGSILEWIKHDLPLVTLKGEPTRQVHTYDKRYRVPAGYQQVIR